MYISHSLINLETVADCCQRTMENHAEKRQPHQAIILSDPPMPLRLLSRNWGIEDGWIMGETSG